MRYLLFICAGPKAADAPAAATGATVLRPDFLPARQLTLGEGDQRFAALFHAAHAPFRGRIVIVTGRSDAIRSSNPTQQLMPQLASWGYASWLLLRDNDDQDLLKVRTEQLLTLASSYTIPEQQKRSEMIVEQTGVLLLLHADGGQQASALVSNASVQALVLLSADTTPELNIDKPLLDCFAQSDRSDAFVLFQKRRQHWQGNRHYRALQLNVAQDQRFSHVEEWLARQIVGWWRRQLQTAS